MATNNKKKPAARGYREMAWQTMRVLRKGGTPWTQKHLAALCECQTHALAEYVRELVRLGYVTVVRRKRNGQRGGDAVYRLARDTGPLAPRIRMTATIYDPNLETVVEPGSKADG